MTDQKPSVKLLTTRQRLIVMAYRERIKRGMPPKAAFLEVDYDYNVSSKSVRRYLRKAGLPSK